MMIGQSGHKQWMLVPAAFICSLLTLTQGCSSTPRPDVEIAGANAAVVSAESQDATLYAPVSMDRAKSKLKRAEQAMQKENYHEAKRLSEEAQADAELAQATASKTRAETSLKDLQASLDALRQQVLRSQPN